MVQVPSPVTLKKEAQAFAAHAYCRTCYMKHHLSVSPCMPFATEHTCCVVQCENHVAYLVIEA